MAVLGLHCYSLVVVQGFSPWWLLWLQNRGFRAHELSGVCCLEACGILVPGPGIEPASCTLAGGFLTTRPGGKSLFVLLLSNRILKF